MKVLVLIQVVAMAVLFFDTNCQAMEKEADNSLACEITRVIKCTDSGECTNLTTSEAKLPGAILIGLTSKRVVDPTMGYFGETSFFTISATNELTVLGGYDPFRGWNAVLSNNNSRLTATISGPSSAFVIFGDCRSEAQTRQE